MAGPWTLTNKSSGKTRSFPTRGELRAFQRKHPGHYKSGEYRRRTAPKAGLSLAQRRGHPTAGERPVTSLEREGFVERTKPETLRRYHKAIENVAKGQSLSEASRNARIHPETVRRLDRERGMLSKEYTERGTFRGYMAQSSAAYPILTADGDYFPVVQLDAKNASLMGRYWNDVKAAVGRGDWNRLNRWHGVEVRDIEGNVYLLATDADELQQFFQQMTDEQQEDFNRAFGSEKVRLRRAS